MVGISTAIQITDRVSAPMMSIISSLEATQNAFERLGNTIDDSFDSSAINNARQELSAAVEQLSHIGDEQENVTNKINKSSDAMDGFIQKIGAAVAAYASIATVKKVMDMSDELVSTNARLQVMNDNFEKVGKSAMEAEDTMNLIYYAAQDARSELGTMADVVARFGNNAGDAFSGTEEVARFANLVQKQMTIAGASTEEASNAILQLSQALGSGVLRGDELNSIFEQSPNLIQGIADYLDVPIGKIREMAQDGQLTADVVKASVFEMADEIDERFNKMPMTWNQLWTSMGNTAVMQFQPVLDKVNEIANNQQFMEMINGLLASLATVAVFILNIMELAGSAASFISDHWSVIEPIVWGIVTAFGAYIAALTIYNGIKAISATAEALHGAAMMFTKGETFAATVAQYGFNTALLACPITWIVLGIIAAVVAIIAFANHIANAGGVATTWFGVICGWINVVIQFFANLGQAIVILCENMVTAFHNAIANVQTFFYNLLSTAMSVIASIANALNNLPFVEIDVSGLNTAANNYAGKAAEAQAGKQSYKDFSSTFQSGWVDSAYSAGAEFGDGVSNKVSSALDFGNMTSDATTGFGNAYDTSQMASNVADTAGNTAKAADALNTTTEELKYLRDIAERDTVNRFTTASISVTQNNTNNVSGTNDIDGITDSLNEGIMAAIDKATEGVHK